MSLSFLTSNQQDNTEILMYLSNHAHYNHIKNDLFKVLEAPTLIVKTNTLELILENLANVCKVSELDQVFNVMAIRGIESEKLIFCLLAKDIYSTAQYVSNYINRSSPIMLSILRSLTEKIIINIVNHTDSIPQYENMSYLEDVRDIWLEFMQRHSSDKDTINSVFIQLLSGYIGVRNNCQQQSYLVDLLSKTKYGTHYSIEKFTDLDYYFLEAVSGIAEKLTLPNKNIIKYLHLNPSNNWIDLYMTAKDMDLSENLEDLKDLSFIV